MPYRVIVRPRAQRQLDKLPLKLQIRLVKSMQTLRDDPRPPGCKKLRGESNLYRIRVGDYRVVYAIEDDVLIVYVLQLGHRRDVYG